MNQLRSPSGTVMVQRGDAWPPTLEHYPEIGRPFLKQEVRSIEASIAVAALRTKLSALTHSDALRELVSPGCLVLYVRSGTMVYLLSIRHHRQLSCDLQKHWESG